MENLKQGIQDLMGMNDGVPSYYILIAVKIVLIIVIGRIFISIFNRVIMNLFKLYPKFKMDEKKTITLAGILKSIVKYTVYVIMIISVLNVLNIPTAPLLATAGFGGLAVGFGAQSLVKDVFTGFFILFEDQYGVGDLITIGNMNGTVEEIGLRITKIREYNGDIHIIPNGEVKTVTNHSRGDSLAIIDIGIAYEADAEKAMTVLTETAERYHQDNPESIVEKPAVMGIIKFNESEAVIRTVVRTKPLMHWKVEREMRKHMLEAFKKQGIEIPYPKRVIINGKEA
ncbi:MAG: mechanosensitive ion channel family protein [Clostridiaceae bacterium]|jgi:small conductance mechanosensitive channel|nr:mechanosensitive ion channel family protein [Clostridiaceae bacterium]